LGDAGERVVDPFVLHPLAKGPEAVGHACIARKKGKGGQDTGALVMRDEFVVDQGIAALDQCLQQLPVFDLSLVGMGKDQIGFVCQELGDFDFFETKDEIGVPQVFSYVSACFLVFRIGKGPFDFVCFGMLTGLNEEGMSCLYETSRRLWYNRDAFFARFTEVFSANAYSIIHKF
jgi:hypothetical protein